VRVVVGITGASGAVYGKRAVEVLVAHGCAVDIVPSRVGERVFEYEVGESIEEFVSSLPAGQVRLHRHDDMFSPLSSGSTVSAGMVVIPCSMGTLGHIASGAVSNLLHRVADVMLKERRRLVLVVRETPISRIHAENILKVTSAGAIVVPACPAFYGKPEKVSELVDFVVERALRVLLEKRFNLVKEWSGL